MEVIQSYIWTVCFSGNVPDIQVTATTEEGAKKTALYARKLVGPKVRKLTVLSCVRGLAVGRPR